MKDVETNPVAPFERDSDTSVAAARQKKESSRVTERLRVLTCIEFCGEVGATREEIGAILRLDGDTVRPRVWELLGSGGKYKPVICESGKRKTSSGRWAKVLKCMSTNKQS